MGVKGEVTIKMDNVLPTTLAVIAALAWHEAIIAILKQVYGNVVNVPAVLTYAITVTIIAIFAAVGISRVAAKAKR
jgi:uncharacterized membrane protein YidH (DUF202 family)